MSQLAKLRHRLAEHGIRGMSDYAEILVAEATRGERAASGVNQGYDVIAPQYGRVEVKCRCLPSDGGMEDRVDLRDTKAGGFDYLAVVLFYPNFEIKGAVLVPYEVVWPIVDSRDYRRIRFAEARQLERALDITEHVVAASQR